jgi:hypothetical protein
VSRGVRRFVQATHVLVWQPPWMLLRRQDRDLGGYWLLQGISDLDRGGAGDNSSDADLDHYADPVLLSSWAGSVLGYPVRITPEWQRIGRWFPWRRNLPYWVTPDEWGLPS